MTKEIGLTKGYIALVDDEDYPELVRYNWMAYETGDEVYAARKIKNDGPGPRQITLFMHRAILGNPEGEVDHRNNNGIDNQRSNLRIATRAQNMANSAQHGNRSLAGYRGVYKSGNKWMARISDPVVKMRYLGTYTTREEAALAYNKAALEQYGEFATLNVISATGPYHDLEA